MSIKSGWKALSVRKGFCCDNTYGWADVPIGKLKLKQLDKSTDRQTEKQKKRETRIANCK